MVLDPGMLPFFCRKKIFVCVPTFSLWFGLFYCVLVPGTLAFHLLCLDEFRPFGFLFSQSVTTEFVQVSL